MQLIGLLVRRNADPPTVRVAAQLPAVFAGRAHATVYNAAAALEPEPLATQRNRAGDLPYDFTPSPVPNDERTPYPAGQEGPNDAAAIAHARSLVTLIHQRGMISTDTEGEQYERLNDQLWGDRPDPTAAVAGVAQFIADLDAADEHGIGNEDAAALQENLAALADLGWREPYDSLYPYDEPTDDEPAY